MTSLVEVMIKDYLFEFGEYNRISIAIKNSSMVENGG